MRLLTLWSVVLCVGCATTPEKPAARAPDLTRPEGGLLVALTSSASDPRPQAEAFAAFVQESTGQPTRGVVFPDYDSLAAALGAGRVDIAFLSPLAFVRAAERGPVQAVLRAVRNGRDTYRAILFAHRRSQLSGLESLARASNLRAAWVDASSATGHVFPKALMVQRGLNPAGIFAAQDFLGSHDAVCRAVAEDRADVGATFVNGPEAGEVEGCQQALGPASSELVVLAATEEIPNDVLAVRSGFDPSAKGRLLIGATMLPSSEEGKRTLRLVFLAEGFSQIKRDDYEVVRKAVQVFRP